jgi:hypothetical protein
MKVKLSLFEAGLSGSIARLQDAMAVNTITARI